MRIEIELPIRKYLNLPAPSVVRRAEFIPTRIAVQPPNDTSSSTSEDLAACHSSDRSPFRESTTLSMPAADNRVLFIAPRYPELVQVFDVLLVNHLQPVHVENVAPDTVIKNEFAHVFVDITMPGALNWLQQVGDQQDEVFPMALIQQGSREGSALAAGATGTLQLPLEAADVLLCVNRNR